MSIFVADMLFLDLLFTLLKGILIGVLVSAPMGPTGLLCLRETTRGGRREGMLVGLGATLSDLVYGLIAYLGVGFVLNLLDRYSSELRLGGSIFILAFCAILLTRRVQTDSEEEVVTSHPLKSTYSVKKVSGAFFLTLSNPFIILLFLPLYARLEFVRVVKLQFVEFFTAMAGIGLGCLLWWIVLTYVVRKVSARFGVRSLEWINRLVALALIIIALLGIYSVLFE